MGIDPGFASTGFSLLRLGKESSQDQIVLMGLIRTQKSSAVRKIRASDDNLARAREIYADLCRLVDQYNVRIICAETMSYPRNASSAAKMSMCWGVIASLSFQKNLPVVQASPQEIKKKLCGLANASKEDIQVSLNKKFKALGVPDSPFLRNIPKSAIEHPYDALASVIACQDSDVMLMARRTVVCAE